MFQLNLSFEQRNLHGPVTSTPKNCFSNIGSSLTLLLSCNHILTIVPRQDGDGFIYRDTCKAIMLGDKIDLKDDIC